VTTSKSVVVYGASGFTGRLVAEYLRELALPFVAAGRDEARVRSVMERVPGIETADYEVVGVEHSRDALADLLVDADVICNTVGPFIEYGHEVVGACLDAGCHYLDTSGEQNWMIEAEDAWSQRFAECSLLLAPSTAHMYTTGHIAANICLETPGLDTLDVLALWNGFPTYASAQTIFAVLMADHYYLDRNAYARWPRAAAYEVAVPGQHEVAIALPWGGGAHPVWFRRDPRVANCRVLGGVFDRQLMEGIVEVAKRLEEEVKPLAPDEQRAALSERAASLQAGMLPRENQLVNRSLDSVYASGPLGTVHCVLQGTCNYKQTGLLQAYAAHHLVNSGSRRVGFASACQAFGHRELLGVLQSFGLSGTPVVNGQVSATPVQNIGPATVPVPAPVAH
jgi:Family of unknown function (DUF5938)/Saccharopine dehydrogenase NADP binding domain